MRHACSAAACPALTMLVANVSVAASAAPATAACDMTTGAIPDQIDRRRVAARQED